MKARKSSEPSKSRQIATEVSVLEFYNWPSTTLQRKKLWMKEGERSWTKRNELVTSLMHLRISFQSSTSLQWFCLKFNRTCWMFTISPKIRYEEQMEGNSHALGFNGSGSSRQKSIWVKFTPLGEFLDLVQNNFQSSLKIEGELLTSFS